MGHMGLMGHSHYPCSKGMCPICPRCPIKRKRAPISNSGAADQQTPWLYRYTIHAMMMIECGVIRVGKLFIARVKSLLVFFALGTCNAAPVFAAAHELQRFEQQKEIAVIGLMSHLSHVSYDTKYKPPFSCSAHAFALHAPHATHGRTASCPTAW